MSDTVRLVRLLDPTAKPRDDPKPLAQRHTDLRGKRIGILDNTKANADILMLRLAELLRQQYGATEVVHRRKAHAAIGATSALLDDMAGQCDVVLLGSGD
jgi:hypothetical protein